MLCINVLKGDGFQISSGIITDDQHIPLPTPTPRYGPHNVHGHELERFIYERQGYEGYTPLPAWLSLLALYTCLAVFSHTSEQSWPVKTDKYVVLFCSFPYGLPLV